MDASTVEEDRGREGLVGVEAVGSAGDHADPVVEFFDESLVSWVLI